MAVGPNPNTLPALTLTVLVPDELNLVTKGKVDALPSRRGDPSGASQLYDPAPPPLNVTSSPTIGLVGEKEQDKDGGGGGGGTQACVSVCVPAVTEQSAFVLVVGQFLIWLLFIQDPQAVVQGFGERAGDVGVQVGGGGGGGGKAPPVSLTKIIFP